MSTIGSTTGTTSGNGLQKTAPTGSSALGKNEFLKLLTTQLSNQDPLSPTDNQAFIAQLAQFASVEQSEAMVSRLDSLLLAQTANNQTAVANLVGKDVIFKTGTTTLTAGGSTTIDADLSSKAAIANAIITDENGKKIRTISLTNVDAGKMKFEWDGKDDAGNPVAAGTYKVQLTAADADQKSLAITQQGRGRVSAVSFDNGIPELVVGGQRIKMSDVLQVAEGTATSNSSTTNAPLNSSLSALLSALTP